MTGPDSYEIAKWAVHFIGSLFASLITTAVVLVKLVVKFGVSFNELKMMTTALHRRVDDLDIAVKSISTIQAQMGTDVSILREIDRRSLTPVHGVPIHRPRKKRDDEGE